MMEERTPGTEAVPGPDRSDSRSGGVSNGSSDGMNSGASDGVSDGMSSSARDGMSSGGSDRRAGAEPAAPLWAPGRRPRRGRTTPLGFAAGDSCPRICGGVLDEQDGSLRCTVCDFRYPEAAAGPQLDHAAPQPGQAAPQPGHANPEGTDTGPHWGSSTGPLLESGAEPPRDSGALADLRLAHAREIQSLQARSAEAIREVEERSAETIRAVEAKLGREIASLEEANRRLLQMVYDLVNGQPPAMPDATASSSSGGSGGDATASGSSGDSSGDPAEAGGPVWRLWRRRRR